MVIPTTPVSNAVEHKNRIALRLNRAGTEFDNPVAGTSRYNSSDVAQASGGFNIRVNCSLVNSTETIAGANVTAYDVNDAIASTTSFGMTENTTTLKATADLIAGVDFPTTALGYRNEVVITTSLNRVIRQQIYVRDTPSDIVVLNGQVTTADEPLIILMDAINGSNVATWRCGFFPSWNDEVGRSHGANLATLQGQIIKPYGGALTVEVYRTSISGVLVHSEQPCQELTTMSYMPSSDGEVVEYWFKFRSATGSGDYVLGKGFVKFVQCEEGGGAVVIDTGVTPDDEPPQISFPPNTPDSIVIPPNEVGYWDPTAGEIDVILDDLGRFAQTNTDFTNGEIVVDGYSAGDKVTTTGDNHEKFVKYVASTEEGVTAAEIGTTVTVSIPAEMATCDFLIVSIRAEGSSTDAIMGNTLVYMTNASDQGTFPQAPQIESSSPAPSFSWSTSTVTFTINDFGWPNEDVTCHCQPLYGEIRNQLAAQSFDDIGIETAVGKTTSTLLYSAGTGSQSVAFTLLGTPEAVAVWFTNNFGASEVFVFFERTEITNAGEVKKGPQATGFSLTTTSTTNDTIQFTLNDDGGANAAVSVSYAAFGQDYYIEGAAQNVAVGSGTRSIVVEAGHEDLDAVYAVTVYNEQGSQIGRPRLIDNRGGVVQLNMDDPE